MRLALGFLTPLCYGGVCALMLVAMLTNHLKNGFFLSSAKEGYEYVALHRGAVDHRSAPSARASGRSTTPSTSRSRSTRRRPCSITAIVGIGGTAAFLGAFWRPPEEGPGPAA